MITTDGNVEEELNADVKKVVNDGLKLEQMKFSGHDDGCLF